MLESFYNDSYWLARFIIQRGVGLSYLIAFLVALNQFKPLVGENGLYPVQRFLDRVPFRKSPSIFYWKYSDSFFTIIAWTGILLSLSAVFGLSDMGPIWLSMLIWFLLWVLYQSIVNVGQIFWGYGWESLLLEAGFYVIFLAPFQYEASIIVIFILRWLVFRVEFGAGLIKMRGDPCWRELTCMNYHHETQPMPNPLSWLFHNLPQGYHKFETLGNHFVQLVAVWFLFFPQPYASMAALLIMGSQIYLIISGNYSWLNWMTVILATSGLSDGFLQTVLSISTPATMASPLWFWILIVALAVAVIWMSRGPVMNMVSPTQKMNFSFNPINLVNTYGAFGSVTRRRKEIVIEGTTDEEITSETEWKAYEFKGKPTEPSRMPPQIAPYHLRLDWQMWFAAMRGIRNAPWLLELIKRFLQDDKPTLKLIKSNPFEAEPPSYIRARLFRYEFTSFKEKRETGNWWKREYLSPYLNPVSLKDLEGV
ncbi:MAG: lipase maturation factor family protein [Bacteroidetes bacterium]|jgi:hypothetical protein|nr:lipase maturation factor family protein [Bacteroidota bacterium]